MRSRHGNAGFNSSMVRVKPGQLPKFSHLLHGFNSSMVRVKRNLRKYLRRFLGLFQ